MASVTELGTLLVRLKAETGQYTSAFEAAEKKTGGSMSGMAGAVGKASVAIVAALAAISAAATREWAQFDDAMQRSTLRMRGASEDMKNRLADQAREIARTSGHSAVSVAQGYDSMARAGFTAEQALLAVGVAADYADAANLDVATSARQLASTMTALGLRTSDAAKNTKVMSEVSDQFAMASVFVNGSMEEMGSAIADNGTLVRQLSGGLSEALSVMAAYSQQGIGASESMGKLQFMLNALRSAAETNKSVWAELGVTLYDASGKLLPMTSIMEQFGRVLGPLPDQQRKMALEMLGINSKIGESIQPLMNSTALMREYEAQIKGTSGTMKDMAGVMNATFSDQWSKLLNIVNDVFIEIGKNLAPVVKVLISYLEEWGFASGGVSENLKLVSDIIKTGVIVAIQVVMDVWYGWTLIIKGGQVVFTAFMEYALKAFKLIITGLNEMVQNYVDGLNVLVKINNATYGRISDIFKQKEFKFTALDGVKNALTTLADGAHDARVEIQGEFTKLANDGRPSEKFMERLDKMEFATTAVVKATQTLTSTVVNGAAQMAPALDPVNAKLALMKVYATDLKESIKEPWEAATEKIGQYRQALDAGLVSQQEFNLAMDKMGVREGVKDPFEDTMNSVASLTKRRDAGLIDGNDYNRAVDSTLQQGSNLFGSKTLQSGVNFNSNVSTGLSEVDEMSAMLAKEQQMQESYARQREIVEKYNADILGGEQNKLKLLASMDSTHLRQQEAFVRSRNTLLMQSMGDSIGQLAEVIGQASGKQSAAYKVMFAASKAFAIADASVKVGQGIAAAAAQPWPLNLAAIASTIAATASLVSNIMAVTMSFEGGGLTPGGPRSGGLDGKGGFMAMMHPNERVIDLTRDSDVAPRAGGGDTTNVTVNQTFTGGVTRQDLDRRAATIKQEAMEGVMDGVSRGGNFRHSVQR